MKHTDAAWLAGMWEGEGSVLLYSRPVDNSRLQITPSLTITNTDVHIMNRIRSLLESINCFYSWQEPQTRKKHWKQAYRLTTGRADYIKTTLETILPFMVGEKKAKGETLLSFVSRRIEKVNKTDHKSFKHLPYDEEDYQYLRSSETTRETSEYNTDDDIVHSSVKALE